MVDVHYIKRGNKSYGPYYYRSYRVGNKVKKEYLGKDYPKSIHKNKNKRKIISFFVLLFLATIVIPLVMFFGGITGKTTLGANTTLQSNESLQTSGDNLTKEIINLNHSIKLSGIYFSFFSRQGAKFHQARQETIPRA